MRTTAIVNLNSSNFIKSIKHNYLIIIFTVIYIIGIFLGVYFIRVNPDVSNITENYFTNFLSARQNLSFFNILLKSYFEMLPALLLVFICGTSMVGVALLPIALSFHGFTFGLLSGFLCLNYQLKGVAFNALILVPSGLFCTILLIICSNISFNYSMLLIKASLPKSFQVNLFISFKNFCKKFLLYICFLMITALVDALMTIGFLNLFSF